MAFFKNKKAMYSNHGMNGFFSRLWKGIKRVVGKVIGALIGGPVGLLVGTAIDRLLNQPHISDDPLWDGSGIHSHHDPILGQRTDTTLTVQATQEFPLTPQEEQTFYDYFEFDFIPTFTSLSNMIDAEININVANKTLQFQLQPINTVVTKANEVLEAISCYRAYNTLIENIGEPRKTQNYVANKVYFTDKFLVILEKAVLKYVEDNKTSELTLVSVDYDFSNINQIKTSKFNWQGNIVTAKLKKYVDATRPPVNDVNPIPIDVTNTNVDDFDAAATNEPQDIVVVPQDQQKSSNLLLKGGMLFAAGVLTAKIFKE